MPAAIVAAGNAGLKREVIPDIEGSDQIELLKYQTKPVAAQRRQAGIVRSEMDVSASLISPPSADRRPANQMQKRALAAAGFAGQRDALACRDAQVSPRAVRRCARLRNGRPLVRLRTLSTIWLLFVMRSVSPSL